MTPKVQLTQVPEELQLKKIWWECACEIKCLCGAAQFVVTDEGDSQCDECGRIWGLSTKLWCTSPVRNPSNNAVHLTPAADALSTTDDTEPQAQVTADR